MPKELQKTDPNHGNPVELWNFIRDNIGPGVYNADIDNFVWKYREGRPVVSKVLEFTSYQKLGENDVPSLKLLQSVWQRVGEEQVGKLGLMKKVSKCIKAPLFAVLYRDDFKVFNVADLNGPGLWNTMTPVEFMIWFNND